MHILDYESQFLYITKTDFCEKIYTVNRNYVSCFNNFYSHKEIKCSNYLCSIGGNLYIIVTKPAFALDSIIHQKKMKRSKLQIFHILQ